MTDFGSPQRHDPTSRWERMVNEVTKKMIDFGREIGPDLLNRPPGTMVTPMEDRKIDFETIRDDIPALQAWHKDLMAQFGAEWGTQLFVREYKKMMSNGSE